jgi:hypothetical protein
MEITSRMMLKPAYSAALPLAGEKVPQTVFDRAASDKFVSAVRVYRAPAPSNDVLKEGLLRGSGLSRCTHTSRGASPSTVTAGRFSTSTTRASL